MYKMIFKGIFCMTLYIALPIRVSAQDPHFSQYFSSPLTFNPAFTGYFNGTQRLAVNIRNQWANLNEPYTTGTVSFDTRIMDHIIGKNDKWGLGVMALYDQSGGGIFKNNYFSLSTGFNKGLDADGGQSIGMGIQATYGRNSIDFTKVSFGSQYSNGGFDISIPSGESINNQSVSFFDLNAGLLYTYTDENENQFTIGASVYHLLQPKLNFFSGNNQSVPPRYAFHMSASLNVGDRNQFFLSTNLVQQKGNNELLFGGAYGLGIGDTDNQLFLGSWLRIGDAFFPYLGLHTSKWQVGLTYDITVSDIRKARGFTGSSEISFVYYLNKDKKKGIPCFF